MSWVAKSPLAAILERVGRAVAVLATAALVAPDPAGAVLAAVVVVAVVAAPLGRVAWLAWSWRREGDGRFAALAGALLAVVAAGTVLGVLA